MKDEPLKETLLSKETMSTGHIMTVERWQARLADGSPAQREIVRHQGAAAVVAVDDQNRVVLVRQYRCPLERITLEIPAGKLDHPGEDPLGCAQRELKEETGFTAESWQKLMPMASTPGFCDEVIHLYLARGLHTGTAVPDEGEFINTCTIPLHEAVNRVMAGEIQDAKTALGLLMAWHLLNG